MSKKRIKSRKGYMDKAGLISNLSDIEWEDFEVKEAKSDIPKSVWETVSAFSNTNGGWLVLGIRQSGKSFEVTGVQNSEKLTQDFLNTIRGGKFNEAIATIQKKYKIEGKQVLAFYIPVSGKKPIYFNSLSNTFIRRGSADQRATREEIDSMYRDQSFGTKTSETVPGSSPDSLHSTSLKRYRDYMTRFNPIASYNRFEENEFLEKLRILENGQCSYGGLLMFGKRVAIEKHFPDFRIDLLEIPGTSYSDSPVRYTFRLEEQENLWEYYFECFSRLKTRVDITFRLTAEGFGQELSPGLESIREALVNMLMHADYFSPAHPRIRIFEDRIEFYNPGGLPKPLEELKRKDISLPRNPIITKLFRMVKLAENAGFGLDKIESNWIKYNDTAPIYDIDFDSTLLTLPLKETSKDTKKDTQKDTKEYTQPLSGNERMVLDEIRNNPHITALLLSENMGINPRNVKKYIGRLKARNLLIRIGSARKGYWQILG
ncbi:MAG: putative DNA binding domain-containing protein [Bacteroidia bacterium]|nr:putative DNA binding domain-containing protein [Bacteroidia bacterium]